MDTRICLGVELQKNFCRKKCEGTLQGRTSEDFQKKEL